MAKRCMSLTPQQNHSTVIIKERIFSDLNWPLRIWIPKDSTHPIVGLNKNSRRRLPPTEMLSFSGTIILLEKLWAFKPTKKQDVFFMLVNKFEMWVKSIMWC